VTDAGNAMFNLPIADLAADNCVLFMWMVDWAPGLALDVMRAWGFEHKTTAFTWVKQTKDETGFAMGQGYWTRANPEACWLGTRGHPKRVHADVRQLVVCPIMEHSKKPEIIHDHIERLVDGPYLELFARRPRDKWQTWGNELAFKMLEIPAHDPATGEIMDRRPPMRPDHFADDDLEIPVALRRSA
jgi:N6-adenosine-specific RNA methylase IME4